jgi:hypothetical protein
MNFGEDKESLEYLNFNFPGLLLIQDSLLKKYINFVP